MTSTLGANGYTRRDPGFSFRFVRLLTKTAAALEIGPEGCWLLAVVVMQEDACRYKRPVYFYNRQLCDLVGIRDERTLLKLRNQLVGAGWLRYLPGGTRSPGMYYVAIPDHAQGIEDSPTTEDAALPASDAGNHVGNRDGDHHLNHSGNRAAHGGGNDDGPSTLSLARPLAPSPSNREREAPPKQSGLEHLLDNLLVSSSKRMRTRWLALARFEAGAESAGEEMEAIEWAVTTARTRGRTVNYPNHVVAEAKEWRDTQRARYRHTHGKPQADAS